MVDLGVNVHCVIIEKGWKEIDTIEDYTLVSNMLEYFKAMNKQYTYDMDDIVHFMNSNKKGIFKLKYEEFINH